MPVTVKVGVTWRRDGREAAHQGDIQALQSMGDSEFILDVYSLIWANAPVDPNTTLKQGNLEEMDVLVVPGGPHANQSQVSLTLTKEIPEPKNTPPTKDKNYASARASSELDLIEKARYLGMPILAFCGGSWRLLQSYGGQTIEVGSLTNDARCILPLGVHDVPERAPGRAEKALNLGPLLRRGIALRDDAVAEPRRFGSQSGVLCQLIFAEMVEFRLQGGQTPIEIPGWMRFALAVDDPPIQFPASRLMDIKILGRYATNARVEGNDFGERHFIIGVRVAALEDNRTSRGVIRHYIRA